MPRTKALTTKHFKVGGKLESTEQTFFKSPYYLSSYDFPYNPDNLCAGNNYTTYDEMRHDDQIKAALSIKKDMVVGTGWAIKCEDDEAREFITTNLRDMNNEGLEASFEEVLRDILSAYDYGFSLSEAIFAIGEDGLYKIKTVKVRPPHSFKFDLDERGNVTKIIQSTSTGKELSLEPNIFLHFAYQMEFGNPYGVSDLKSAFTPWKMKKFGLRFYAKFLERFVSPIVHGAYDAAGSANEAEAIYDVLNSIQNSSVIVTPKNVEVNFIQPEKGGADIYQAAIDHLDLKIARAILMPDLLGLSGGKTQGGAYALGTTQFKVFLDTIKKDRELLARKITQKIVNPLAQANWGINAEFCFLPYSAGDEMEMAKLWIEAVKTGKFNPSDEEINNLRKITKFPEGEVERPSTPAPAENPNGGPKAGENEGNGGMEDDDEEVEAEEIKENKEFHRPLTRYEKKVNFKEVKQTLDSSESRGIPKIKRSALRIANSILDQIKEKKILENFKPEALNSLKPKFMREMNIVFRDHFQDLFYASQKEAKQEIMPDQKYVDSELLPDEFLDVIEAESFKAVGDYSNDILKRAGNILANGLKTGSPTSEIYKAIAEELAGFTDKWVNTVVRTKTTEVYNAARKTYWENDEIAKSMITGYKFSAILDDRTSDVCAFLDKKGPFEKGDFTDRITPPLHFNCRSLLVPVTKFEDVEFDEPIPIDELKEMGAGLIYQEIPSMPESVAMPIVNPNIIVSGEISKAGDSIVVAPSGPMTFVKVLSMSISNADNDHPVVVGTRHDYYEPLKHETMLSKQGGRFEKTFTDGWIFPENKGMFINLSANALVKWTLEYIIVDINGVRIR